MKSIYLVAILCVALSLVLTACVPPTPQPTPIPTPQPTPTAVLTTSEEFVTAAWKAYERNDFPTAIELAKECVNRWESEATKQQSELTQAPPNGKVGEDEKKVIFAHWALNDVGTAYFIIGAALQNQGKNNEAKEPYEKAKKFPYARTWDPKGWFWAPSEEASNRLAKIP